MLTPRPVAIVVALLLVAAVPAGAQEPPPPAVPAVVQIEDAAGDANYLNGQGTGAGLGDRTTPQDLAVSDILKVWFTHDAETISVNVQTEAPPPSSDAAYTFEVNVNPAEGDATGCLQFAGYVGGATFVGEPRARLWDRCIDSDEDTVGGELRIVTLADGTGVTTMTFPRAAHSAFADDAVLAAPWAAIRHHVEGPGTLGYTVAGAADDTKVGDHYRLTRPEEEHRRRLPRKRRSRERPSGPSDHPRRDACGWPGTTKRHGMSSPRPAARPILVVWDTSPPRSSSVASSSAHQKSPPRSSVAPLCARSMASACARRAGPDASSLSAIPPRRTRISSVPSTGSPARRSTASHSPSRPHTTFAHQCMPYVKYT